ncbi:MAG: YggT family protein [Rudaea sp.]|uniref:YggT family protein n=1 Tax=unclassified Rudaea TaxID=2627037 RepID=UPI0010F8D215|nr:MULTISPECIES: YggT family protein [unclassified Rudaea]MBN8885842.1 YggT family protein [Rudaea sp.]MBR0346961.1 YggT family protein [Rudaea sp.]
MPYLANAAVFLIQTFFDLLIGIFLIRTMLIAVNASFYDPICQFVYKVTNPVITPIRRFFPRAGKIDTASVAVAFVLALVELALLAGVVGSGFSLSGWLVGAVVTVLSIAVWIAFWALLIRAVLSFFTNERHNPNAQVLVQITEPVVRPFRRFVPPVGGMDFSFLIASVALILVRLLVIAPLADLAARL